jgi:hypothetical protein
MFKINRLKIIVKTSDGNFGFDDIFHERINFIASYENTKGKSSCIEVIYYCLGLEELIGGKNEQALKPVFKKTLEYQGVRHNVLESEFYLEIKNSQGKVITIYRTAGKAFISPNLLSIFDGSIDSVFSGKATFEDMYIHQAGAATNQRGFHRYLEDFLGWSLPEVPTFDDVDRKLYIQTIFSALFIEQKRGWSNILATIPTNFKIKDVRQRVIEFIIGLHTIENERRKQKCKAEEARIKQEWHTIISNANVRLMSLQMYLQGIPVQPEILDDNFIDRLLLLKRQIEQNDILFEEYMLELQNKLNSLKTSSFRIVDNSEALQEELSVANDKAKEIEKLIEDLKEEIIYENTTIIELKKSLEIINKDLQNNKDAQKLKKMGSTQEWLVNKDICPTCHQKITDSLLPQSCDYNLMSIEQNIDHLESQKTMLEFGLSGHKKSMGLFSQNIEQLEKDLNRIRKIIRSIINDIYSADNDVSETVVHKKLLLETEIEQLYKAKADIVMLLSSLKQLSDDWKKMVDDKKNLPQDKYSEADLACLKFFEDMFRKNLKEYGYTSFTNLYDIAISKDTLLPTVAGFDMKFDSSASDHIRAIWAFTSTLLMTAKSCGGNHPGVLIFDEPDQQSVIIRDMEHFLRSLANSNSQVIIGITLKDDETKAVLKRIETSINKLILIEEKAIAPITQAPQE